MELMPLSKNKVEPSELKPLTCPNCGGSDFLKGKKSALCKNCRTKVKRPKHGYVGPDGKVMLYIIKKCNTCQRTYFIDDETKQKDPCQYCGGDDVSEIDRW